MVFNREEIEKFFRFLNHENLTEMRIINPWEGIKEATFAGNLADFLSRARKFAREYGTRSCVVSGSSSLARK